MSVLIWIQADDTMIVFLKELLKKSADDNKHMKNYQACIPAVISSLPITMLRQSASVELL